MYSQESDNNARCPEVKPVSQVNPKRPQVADQENWVICRGMAQYPGRMTRRKTRHSVLGIHANTNGKKLLGDFSTPFLCVSSFLSKEPTETQNVKKGEKKTRSRITHRQRKSRLLWLASFPRESIPSCCRGYLCQTFASKRDTSVVLSFQHVVC